MKNLFKNIDIFSCLHETHRGFKNKISVYHILKEKKCYPDGCFYFEWRCKALSKKSKCHRGFTTVGRKCFNCRFFYEQKIHNIPELQIPEKEYQDFLKKLDYFEDWLSDLQDKNIEFEGMISSVKPHFLKTIYPKADYLSFKGYILIFEKIFLDRFQMDDFVYGLVPADYYHKLAVGRNGKIEGMARLNMHWGRLILRQFKQVKIMVEGDPVVWNEQKVLVAKETATHFSNQPECCVQCPFGALVDVIYKKDHNSASNRQLLCLKGQPHYKDCYIKAEYCGFDNEIRSLSKEESHHKKTSRHLKCQ